MRRIESWFSMVGKTYKNLEVLQITRIIGANAVARILCHSCKREKEMYVSAILNKQRIACGCARVVHNLSGTPFIERWYRIKNNSLFSSAEHFLEFCKTCYPDFSVEMRNYRLGRKKKHIPHSESNTYILIKNEQTGKYSAYSQ